MDGFEEAQGKTYVVCRLPDGENTFLLEAQNVTHVSYWTCDISEASQQGVFLAEYHRQSEYFPVNSSNSSVKLNPGTRVLVVGQNEFNGCGGPKKETHPIRGYAYRMGEMKLGLEEFYFNSQDMTWL